MHFRLLKILFGISSSNIRSSLPPQEYDHQSTSEVVSFAQASDQQYPPSECAGPFYGNDGRITEGPERSLQEH